MDESKGQAGGVLTPVASNEALMALARRCLWIAYCWNDHNFDHASKYAREEAQRCGIKSFDEANDWLTRPTPAAAAPLGYIHKDAAAFHLKEPGGWARMQATADATFTVPVFAASPAAAAGVPTGWKLVPVEPSMEMKEAALQASRREGPVSPESTTALPTGYELWSAEFVYRAMLAASPVAPAGAPTLTDEQIDGLLANLDEVARDFDHYEYGLPMHSPDDEDSPLHKLRQHVRDFAALLSAGSQGEQHDSSHEAAPQSSVPSASPLPSLPETDDSALPRTLSARITELAAELEGELDSGAKWTQAQHSCCSVSGALQDVAREVASLEDSARHLVAALREEVEARPFDPETAPSDEGSVKNTEAAAVPLRNLKGRT